MLQLIFKLALLVIAFQAVRGLLRRAAPDRGRKGSRFSPKADGDRGKTPDYSDLTPYEIEDADFEELPGKKD